MAAIMYTDMVGYTALGQRNESLSLALVEEQSKKVLEHDPNFLSAHATLYWTYFWQGKYDEAEREAREYLRLRNNDAGSRAWFAVVYQWAGKRDEARKIVDELKARSDVYVPQPSVGLSVFGFGRKGEGDRADSEGIRRPCRLAP